MSDAKTPRPAKALQSAAPAAPAVTTAAPDTHHGHGGMYTVVNGQRVLVQRTGLAAVDTPADTTTATAAPSTPAADAAKPTTSE